MKKTFLFTTFALLSTNAFAASGFRLGTPTYNGTGCKDNNTQVYISQDQKAIGVNFSGYKATASSETLYCHSKL